MNQQRLHQQNMGQGYGAGGGGKMLMGQGGGGFGGQKMVGNNLHQNLTHNLNGNSFFFFFSTWLMGLGLLGNPGKGSGMGEEKFGMKQGDDTNFL